MSYARCSWLLVAMTLIDMAEQNKLYREQDSTMLS